MESGMNLNVNVNVNVVPLALRRTHRANAGAKRKQAMREAEESPNPTKQRVDRSRESAKKKRKKQVAQGVGAAAKSPGKKPKADFKSAEAVPPARLKRPVSHSIKKLHPNHDFYCWQCHRQEDSDRFLYCNLCPRVYHLTCAKVGQVVVDWVCPECEKMTEAECMDTQSSAMSLLNLDQIAKVLRCALEKVKLFSHSSMFLKPVDTSEYSDYRRYVFIPMDLSVVEKNIQKRYYGSTEAFMASIGWIHHNALVYFGSGSRVGNAGKALYKTFQNEMNEVETCPDCYVTSINKRTNWFAEVCTKPHTLIWAKLQGFPFWPAKAMKEKDGLVEARFFGQHDRAMIPVHNCFLYSNQIPFPPSKKRLNGLNNALKEVKVHIQNLMEKLGTYQLAAHLTPYDPNRRYTTNSLAVMPDGKVKGLTEASRYAMMRSKVVENGKEGSTQKSSDGQLVSSSKSSETPGGAQETAEIDVEGSDGASQDSSLQEENNSENETAPIKSEPDDSNAETEMKGTCFRSSSNESEAGRSSVDGHVAEGITEDDGDRNMEATDRLSVNDVDVPVKEEADNLPSSESDRKRKLSEVSDSGDHQGKVLKKSSSDDDDDDGGGGGGDGGRGETQDEVELGRGKEDTLEEGDASDQSCKETDESLPSEGLGSLQNDDSEDASSASALQTPHKDDPSLENSAEARESKENGVDSGTSSDGIASGDDDVEKCEDSCELPASPPPSQTKTAQSTPKKDAFLENLSKTIDTCKASLEDETLDSEEEADEEGMEDVAETTATNATAEVESTEDVAETNTPNATTEVEGAEDALQVEREAEEHAAERTIDTSELLDEESNGENIADDRDETIPPDAEQIGGEQQVADTTGEDDGMVCDDVAMDMEGADRETPMDVHDGLNEEDQENSRSESTGDIPPTPQAAETPPVDSETSESRASQEEAASNAGEDSTDGNAVSDRDTVKNEEDAVVASDDEDNDIGMYGGDSASDGELHIDEGKVEEAVEKNGRGEHDDGERTESRDSASIEPKSDVPDLKEGAREDEGVSAEQSASNQDTGVAGPTPEVETDKVASKDDISAEADGRSPPVLRGDSCKDEGAAPRPSSDGSDKDQKSSEDAESGVSSVPKPGEKDSENGKLVNKIVEAAMRSYTELEDKLSTASGDLKSLVLKLQREVIALKAQRELQMEEMQHCNRLTAAEITLVAEYNKNMKLNNVRKECDWNQQNAVKKAKSTQWCASCGLEANYFCCWNTSYCNYRCQEQHWPVHEKMCQQKTGHFPFMMDAEGDPHKRKKKKKKRKKDYMVDSDGDFDNSDDDPTYEPDPEDLPTMVDHRSPSSKRCG
ncbi:uncharacterized protein, partial [Diadema antillarum]|uniref:uncharacterized protein n=1 Tax=Diadema antillarum TaxID=105358 RepID=UPI003A87DEC6